MPARRIARGRSGAEPHGRPIRFTFDGRTIDAVEGEPVAASLLAAGEPILSRSFRLHRPRGLMCSTGQCGWCECAVDGMPSVRTCRVGARDGLVVRSEHAVPTVRNDVLGVLEYGARWIPPTFYHHRFLRPRRLRRRYLDVIRWFGGRGTLPARDASREPAVTRRERTVDVLVVGGGPAGILAATQAAVAGADVLLVESESTLGSWWRWATGREGELRSAVAALAAAGVAVELETTALGAYGRNVLTVGRGDLTEVHAGAVVTATGSYERIPIVPGNDRPGVLGARTVEWLVNGHGILPGERALLVGEEERISGARAALEASGTACVATIATHALARIDGRRRVRGARYVLDGRPRSEPVDLVVIGDRTPSLELVLNAGATVREGRDGLEPVTDPAGRTSVPWLLAAGSAAGRPVERSGGVDAARAAGVAAANAAGVPRDRAAAGPVSTPVATGPSAEPAADGVTRADRADHDAAVVCFCEDVHAREIRAEARWCGGDGELAKRRTGALTGPCQGKYCAATFNALVAEDRPASAAPWTPSLPTVRPPLRPVRLGELVTDRTPEMGGGPGGKTR